MRLLASASFPLYLEWENVMKPGASIVELLLEGVGTHFFDRSEDHHYRQFITFDG